MFASLPGTQTVDGWPRFAVGIRKLIWRNANYIAVFLMPLLDLPMAPALNIPK